MRWYIRIGTAMVRASERAEGLAGARTATTAIQNLGSELRKLLGSDRLVTQAPGYVLLGDDEELDATRVDRLVARGRAADPEKALALLSEAESLWRGPPLADVACESF